VGRRAVCRAPLASGAVRFLRDSDQRAKLIALGRGLRI
jgi:hypothetical protein